MQLTNSCRATKGYEADFQKKFTSAILVSWTVALFLNMNLSGGAFSFSCFVIFFYLYFETNFNIFLVITWNSTARLMHMFLILCSNLPHWTILAMGGI